MSDDFLYYRVMFTQQEKQYEIHAKYISEEGLMGFIEVEELVFDDTKSPLLVDPKEEKIANEFKGVERFYIPMHNIIRIDEVELPWMKKGSGSDRSHNNNVSTFPRNRATRRKSIDE